MLGVAGGLERGLVLLVVVRSADGLKEFLDLAVLVSGTGWLVERPRLDLLRGLALTELGLLST